MALASLLFFFLVIFEAHVVESATDPCNRPAFCSEHLELVADPENCRNYYQCYHGQWAHFTCNDLSTFDFESLACEAEENCFPGCPEYKPATILPSVHPATDPCSRPPLCLSGDDPELVADPDDCKKYFHCLNNHWAHFTCPVDSTFDSKANACSTNHDNCFPSCPVYTGLGMGG
ncbi:hypothetical protein CAPTEDRAFT_194924 [Capitella teleta]|uniref:Chitin-binding type-2 domain-containing protein n=1 Tax=Capitella teleta TaxID=283909 RepID=R7TU53_CAPTE|nr:hypothetical protein CAPTEDRAFT_194924 [Capitella teleta]|eukprot:ELT97433.1 hypothetical protein CAPTEDRAFT_194924 [Capitella teleta]